MAASTVRLATLYAYKAQGLLKCQRHPKLPLTIWNYSEHAQFSRKWDAVTRMCRGLVVDDDEIVRARSFDKFFNIQEQRHAATDKYEVFEKLDGSLILLFYYDGDWQVASRGSFTSSQAGTARDILGMHNLDNLDASLTYCFEILYPENRIVVNYKGRRNLVFLAAFRPDGTEVLQTEQANAAGFPTARRYDGLDQFEQIKELDWPNSEGFVVRFSNGERVKVKFRTYCDLHKIVSNLSETTVWESFRTGASITTVVESVPDEWHSWLRGVWTDLAQQYATIVDSAQAKAAQLKGYPRKEAALAIKDDPLKKFIFALLDDKDIHQLVCNEIKPVGRPELDKSEVFKVTD